MGWSFRKSFSIGKIVRINLSKRGLGASFGIPGMRFGVGSGRPPRVTGGVGPFRYFKSLGQKRGRHIQPFGKGTMTQQPKSGCGRVLLISGVGAILVMAGMAILHVGKLSPDSEEKSFVQDVNSKFLPGIEPHAAKGKGKSSKPIASAEKAKKLALVRYPSLGIAGSSFNVEFLKRYKNSQTERPDFLTVSTWPLSLADEVGEALHIIAVSPPPKPKSVFHIRTETKRLGVYNYKADLRAYTKSALPNSTAYSLTTANPVIRVPFDQELEIEVAYDPLELAEPTFFSEPCSFDLLSESGFWHRPMLGGSKR